MGYSGLDASIKDEINIEDHINTEIYKKALDSLIEDYPDSTFFQDKLEQFNENNA
jgi:NitT/TauT family transport system substrate-binding protein